MMDEINDVLSLRMEAYSFSIILDNIRKLKEPKHKNI
jgi:intein-encoded DNA endonuclease-like protein